MIINPYIIKPFNLADLPEIKEIWLSENGVALSGSDVLTWTGINGTVLTGLVGNRPTFVPDAINSLPAIRFNGVDQFMTGTILDIGHVFVVLKPTGNETYGSLLSTTTNHVIIRGTSDVLYFSVASIFGETGTLDNMYKNSSLYSGMAFDSEWALYNTSGTPVSGVLELGRDTSGGGYAAGDIAAIIILDKQLTSGNRIDAQTFLLNKYGLPQLM